MQTIVKKLTTPLQFEDREKALVARLFNTVVLTFLGFSILVNFVLPFINPGANYFTSMLLLVICLTLLIFSHYGGYRAIRQSSVLLCVALWVMVSLNSWTDGGLRNMASTSYFAVVIIAGLLLGRVGSTVFAILSILAALAIYIGEVNGFISAVPRSVEFQDWFKLSLVLGTAALLVRFAVSHLRHSLHQLRASEQALSERAQQLEAANQRLQVLSQVKDEFVTNVSHELRTPISCIKLYQDILSRWPEKLDTCLPTLKRETNRLESLIENLLTLSRLDQNRTDFELTSVDIVSLTKEYVKDRAPLAASKELELTLDANEAKLVVKADRDLLGQVLSILLTNALNYTPAGGEIVVSANVQQSDQKSWIGFSVHDTGPGIPAAEQEQLFSRFFRGSVGRSSGVSGTGLGLAIAKEIVDRHQGKLQVHSSDQPGKGSTFSVWLPS